MVNESTVDLIIRDQWRQANKQANQLREVEISGLGTFYPSPKKVALKYLYIQKKLNNLNPLDSRTKRTTEDGEETLSLLKSIKKYGEFERYLEGQASHIVSSKESDIS